MVQNLNYQYDPEGYTRSMEGIKKLLQNSGELLRFRLEPYWTHEQEKPTYWVIDMLRKIKSALYADFIDTSVYIARTGTLAVEAYPSINYQLKSDKFPMIVEMLKRHIFNTKDTPLEFKGNVNITLPFSWPYAVKDLLSTNFDIVIDKHFNDSMEEIFALKYKNLFSLLAEEHKKLIAGDIGIIGFDIQAYFDCKLV